MLSLLFGDPCGVHSAGRTFRGTYGERRTDERNRQTRPTLPKPNIRPDGTNKLSEKDLPIKLEEVDYKVNENAVKHNTKDFDITQKLNLPSLVVRRGEAFLITLKFNKPYDEKLHDIRLLFEFGNEANQTKGTQKDMQLSDEDKHGEWCAWIQQKKGKELTISITTPPDCCVGRWKFSVDIIVRRGNITSSAELMKKNDIIVLFNPWCKDDGVYLEDEQLLNEYVLNENGTLYTGSKKFIASRPWTFDQFDDSILDCSLYLLEESSLNDASRGDPVKVVRAVSRMVNCQDDNGVLVGNWSGNYEGGTKPTVWNGSKRILKQYYKYKKPVAYGQCWVFSALVTTVCRALGIPTRSVTNFASAHDRDYDPFIDKHYDMDGEPMDYLDKDSVWNFHVWNDVWMTRPDLPSGYGGWQAIDATPQETSEGTYQCGPASLEAVKRGEVYLPYDGKFVFAEVNADRLSWKQGDDGLFRVTGIKNSAVGFLMSAKAPLPDPNKKYHPIENPCFDSSRQDVTSDYKFKEGSPEERAALAKAKSFCNKKKFGYVEGSENTNMKQNIAFKLIDIDTVKYGEGYKVIVEVTNTSNKDVKVGGSLSSKSIYYTGVPHTPIKKERIEEKAVPTGTTVPFCMEVTPSDYYNKLCEQCNIKISCAFVVHGTDIAFIDEDDVMLQKPDLTIKVLQGKSEVKVGQKVKVEISFVNPLSLKLTECKLNLDGTGLQLTNYKPNKDEEEMEWQIPQGDAPANGEFKTTVELSWEKAGEKKLIANFDSREMIDVLGSLPFTVTK